MEVPTACLTAGSETVIGGWTTASLPQTRVLNDNVNSTFSVSFAHPADNIVLDLASVEIRVTNLDQQTAQFAWSVVESANKID